MGQGTLTHDELSMLRDADGWEYISISDPGNGFQTQAACFDSERTGACEGTLIFREDNSFTQTISAQGKTMHRGGTYKLDDHNVTFVDEHGTEDGPYSLKIDLDAKTLMVDANRAGVGVHMELLIEKVFKKRLRQKKDSH
jgi:hypothetical protein